MQSKLRVVSLWAIAVVWFHGSAVAALDGAYQELQGPWEAVELVDNGNVIPAAQIPSWLPSGGRIEVVDNAIVFTSRKDEKRHVRTVSLDATSYPRQIDVIDKNQKYGYGIYRIEDGRLIVCLSPPADAPRPTDFSARENSRRMLLVFARPKPDSLKVSTASVSAGATALQLPPPPVVAASPQPAARPLTNADITSLLPGTWKFNDAYGAFFLTLDKRGYFSTYRESVETSAVQKVFRKLPLSSGTWKLNNGQVVLNCTSSVFADRVYKTFPFSIRTVSATDLEFVDYAGNAGKATRAKQ